MKTFPLSFCVATLMSLVSACSQQDSPSAQQPASGKTVEAMLVANPNYANKIQITLLANAGEYAAAGSDYRMVGVGDGIGVYAEGDKVVAVMNHELKESQYGAFVSKWTLDKTTGSVITGEDLTREVFFYDKYQPVQAGMSGYEQTNEVMSRLCSADLPAQSALYFADNDKTYGTQDKIFFSGEETNTSYKPPEDRNGRAFAHMVSSQYAGKGYELPAMGRMSFENIVLNPLSQKKTIAMLMDDAKNKIYTTAWDDMSDVEKELFKRNPPSELYVYIGEKQADGEHPLVRAGLTNGHVYGVRMLDIECAADDIKCRNTPNGENREAWLQGDQATKFELRKIEVPENDQNGHGFQIESYKNGITQFLRLEDGAWDPRPGHENEYYFVTTDHYNGNSRLFKLTFSDITQPEQGGTIQILINGNPEYANRAHTTLIMMDNLTVDPWGRVLIQEDPGSDPRLARIWMYDIATGDIKEIAKHNPKYFDKDAGSPEFLTINEESSGIVQAFDSLGEGWYLLNVQAHAKYKDDTIVQHGQFLKMYAPRDL
jgi:hypothetical protein